MSNKNNTLVNKTKKTGPPKQLAAKNALSARDAEILAASYIPRPMPKPGQDAPWTVRGKPIPLETTSPALVSSERRGGSGQQFMNGAGLGFVDNYVRSKTSHGSKGRKGWNFLTGAAKIAADLAPAAVALAPFFLATHQPTQLNAVKLGQAPQVAAMQAVQSNSVGLAGSNPFQTAIGINKMTTFNKGGVLFGCRVQGIDKLVDIPYQNPITNQAWAEGDLMAAIDLNPTGQAMFGTALIQQARVYNRYRVKNLAITFVSDLPATMSGNLILSCIPDPDSPYTGDGFTGTQTATAVTGAECFQTWQTGCTAWYGDKSQNFYARGDLTDKRFVSPGIANLVCNLPTIATSDLGSLYLSYDIEFSERSLTDTTSIQSFGAICDVAGPSQVGQNPSNLFGNPAGATGWGQTRTPLQTASPVMAVPNGSLPLIYSELSGAGVISNFPIGAYLVGLQFTGIGLGTSTYVLAAVNASLAYYVVLDSKVVYDVAAGAGTTCSAYCIVQVTKQTLAEESGLYIVSGGISVSTASIYVAKILDQQGSESLTLANEMATLKKQVGELKSLVSKVTHQPILPTPGAPSAPPSTPAVVPIQTKPPARIFQLGEVVTADQLTENDMIWLNKVEQNMSKIPYTFVVFSFPKRVPGGDWTGPSHWRAISIPRTIADSRDNDESRRRNFEFASLICLKSSHEARIPRPPPPPRLVRLVAYSKEGIFALEHHPLPSPAD